MKKQKNSEMIAEDDVRERFLCKTIRFVRNVYLRLIKLQFKGTVKMTSVNDYENEIKQYVVDGQMTQLEADDLLAQKNAFDRNRVIIESDYKGKCVGYVDGVFLVADTYKALSAQARKDYPGKLIYFETVGYSLIG